jgi:hypothetical protein
MQNMLLHQQHVRENTSFVVEFVGLERGQKRKKYSFNIFFVQYYFFVKLNDHMSLPLD